MIGRSIVEETYTYKMMGRGIVEETYIYKRRSTMQSDEQEIRQLVATWMEATKAGDADTVLSLMADDVVFLVAGQPPMGFLRARE
jgi:hypothetical protein